MSHCRLSDIYISWVILWCVHKLSSGVDYKPQLVRPYYEIVFFFFWKPYLPDDNAWVQTILFLFKIDILENILWNYSSDVTWKRIWLQCNTNTTGPYFKKASTKKLYFFLFQNKIDRYSEAQKSLPFRCTQFAWSYTCTCFNITCIR